MPFLTWETRFSVGAAMDAEHKTWFGILNRLHDAMAQGKGKDVQQKILIEMVAYTHTHFAHEESFLQSRNYPDLPAHRSLHVTFTKKVRDLESKVKAGLPVLSVELMDFLRDWLQNHILTHDVKYGTWMKANG
ncbi:Hemerythrin-like, metal-binding protein [Candidatus Koribacter versatilis Ellin345]|uniref:Hemerythrin-like, metal-binding protein n=1 Tax=Koribacter versatilis (strain Ellin345) TaxID=204669 RepID=Q1IKE9_KORVE|nr:bacteriohemerythrin [Candidatus Koribacter versatilis]ABF42651.1 Hemerythrin-like, metal-binding protein [Candidatus Koribacter versatilis Ellin345]